MREFRVPNQELIKFRKVTDREFDSLSERYPQWKGECPTCKGQGVFRYKNFQWECDCQTQINLARHYLLANIGITYHSLGFDDLFEGKDEVKDFIQAYLDNWEFNKQYGRGIIFQGSLGTGKTFAQLLILKELIKKGEKCWFVSFSTAVADYVDAERRRDLMNQVRSAVCLSLDEVPKAVSDRQRDLYEEVFESIIRFRVENSMPTLMGTNLKNLSEIYPRVGSLLEMNHIYYEMIGEDTRSGSSKEAVDKLIKNNESRPVK